MTAKQMIRQTGRPAFPQTSSARCLTLMLGMLLTLPAFAGTSGMPPAHSSETTNSSRPALPGSQLPETPATEPHNAGKRSWMKAGVSNLRASTMLREQNKLDPSIVTLKNGLQYKVRVEGTGPKPKKADTVEVHYVGSLIDGTTFASAPASSKPASFKMASVIPGWRQALKMMAVGSKWQLFVPPELGYGVKGLPPNVGPDAMLVYELELVGIQPGTKPAQSTDDKPAETSTPTETPSTVQ